MKTHPYNYTMIQKLIEIFHRITPIRSSDDAIGFFAGTTFTTLFVHAMDWHFLAGLIGRGLAALILGIVGGWAGLLGKDLYKFVSCKTIYQMFIKQKQKRKRKKAKPKSDHEIE